MTGQSFLRFTQRLPAAMLVFCLCLTGCTNVFVSTATTSTPSYQYFTGNWEFTFTPTQGPVPFVTLDGFVQEEAATTAGANNTLTMLMQIEQPTMCYLGGTVLPLQGMVEGTTVNIFSFSFNGQYVSINTTKNATATGITGTYYVGPGCANNYGGTIAGIRYAALSGTYSGTATLPTQKLAVTLTQASLGNADGSISVSGTATLGGFACFSKGTVTGSVLGKAARLNIVTNEAGGSQLSLTGTFDAAASAIQASSLQVTGGSCSGSLGTGTLSH